jgi:parallel beta-helix repeat protein
MIWENVTELFDYNEKLVSMGVQGNIGDRDHVQILGRNYTLQEAQLRKDDWSSWRIFLYDHSKSNFTMLNIKTHKGSVSFSNPTCTMLRSPNNESCFVTTYFIHTNGSANGEAGQLIFYKEFVVVPDDYPTIQEAINNASEGDTIFVTNGTYHENVVVNKTILLIGENKENTIIDGSGVEKVIELAVDGILISNFTISNGEVGIHITDSHRHIIRNNIICRNVRGATGTYYTYTTYEDNIVRENEYGLDFGHLGGPSSSRNLAIGNQIYDNFVGIYVSASEGNNTIKNNMIYENSIGIVLDNTRNNNVVSNTFINNTRDGEVMHGIYLRNSAQNNIEGNIFIFNNVGVFMDRGCSNMIQRNNFTSNSYGVYLTFNESLTYIGWSFDNQIAQNYFLNNTYGIYSNIGSATFIDSQFNTTIIGNEISNNVNGIFLYLSPVNKILENIIMQNDDGIHIELSSSNTIINNTISNNRMNGLTIHLSSDNSLISNNITNSDVAVALSLSSNNLIYKNVIADNRVGMGISLSDDNIIYNNDFVRNAQQVTTDGLSSNKWNSTYPYGGNYWSDYIGTDIYSGPYQNETGSDGIGDAPYIVDINELFDTYNIDYYPLMKPCIVECYTLTIVSEVGGTTNPVLGTYTYLNGTSVMVSAILDVGYSFDYWLLDGEKRTENPIEVLMDSNHTLEAYFVDDIPPEISDPVQNPPPDNVQPFQNVTVWVNATDYGTRIKNVTLWYSLDNGTSWTIINMTELPIPSNITITYEATIPGYENCTWITYKIVAYDKAENNATKDNNGYNYKYHVIPELPSTAILPLLMLTTLIATVLLKKKRKTKPQLP